MAFRSNCGVTASTRRLLSFRLLLECRVETDGIEERPPLRSVSLRVVPTMGTALLAPPLHASRQDDRVSIKNP